MTELELAEAFIAGRASRADLTPLTTVQRLTVLNCIEARCIEAKLDIATNSQGTGPIEWIESLAGALRQRQPEVLS